MKQWQDIPDLLALAGETQQTLQILIRTLMGPNPYETDLTLWNLQDIRYLANRQLEILEEAIIL